MLKYFAMLYSYNLKILGFKSIAFIFVFYLLNYIANYLYIDQVLTYTNLYRSGNQFALDKEKLKILVAGDSHPRANVHPDYLDHSFIVASGGEHTILTYYRLADIIEKQGLGIELVILPLDLHTFSDYRKNTFGENGVGGAHWWREYIDYRELCSSKDKLIDLSCWIKFIEADFTYLGGIQKIREVVRIRFRGGNLSKMYKGFMPGKNDFSKEDEPLSRALTRARSHLSNRNEFDDVLVKYYIRTIEMLTENGVNVVLVRYPITNPYYRMAGRIMDIDQFYQSAMEKIWEENNAIFILDYHDLFWRQNSKFSDPDHLNLRGAIEFTQILQGDLEKLGYIEK